MTNDGNELIELLSELAVTADDSSAVQPLLLRIAEAVVLTIDEVDYASVTARRGSGHTTVAMTSEVALAVDEAQYAAEDGPCVVAADGVPISVPNVTSVIEWPDFRTAASLMGLGSSTSIPLFTASGKPAIALNLYAHGHNALRDLGAAVLAAYHRPSRGVAGPDLGSPGRALVTGLTQALELRDMLQQAIGLVMAREHVGATEAYTHLRSAAVEKSQPIGVYAKALISASLQGRSA